LVITQIQCGSWLACDDGVSAGIAVAWHAAIAGKPGSHKVTAPLRRVRWSLEPYMLRDVEPSD